jgi:hypothetical protein
MNITGTSRKGYDQNNKQQKGDLLNRGSDHRDRVSHAEDENQPTEERKTRGRKHGKRRDDEWTETCPASTTVHRPAENEKERSIVGGTNRVTSDANSLNLHRSCQACMRNLTHRRLHVNIFSALVSHAMCHVYSQLILSLIHLAMSQSKQVAFGTVTSTTVSSSSSSSTLVNSATHLI